MSCRYWDGGYYSFHINQLNANEAGGSKNFFLHVTVSIMQWLASLLLFTTPVVSTVLQLISCLSGIQHLKSKALVTVAGMEVTAVIMYV